MEHHPSSWGPACTDSSRLGTGRMVVVSGQLGGERFRREQWVPTPRGALFTFWGFHSNGTSSPPDPKSPLLFFHKIPHAQQAPNCRVHSHLWAFAPALPATWAAFPPFPVKNNRLPTANWMTLHSRRTPRQVFHTHYLSQGFRHSPRSWSQSQPHSTGKEAEGSERWSHLPQIALRTHGGSDAGIQVRSQNPGSRPAFPRPDSFSFRYFLPFLQTI